MTTHNSNTPPQAGAEISIMPSLLQRLVKYLLNKIKISNVDANLLNQSC